MVFALADNATRDNAAAAAMCEMFIEPPRYHTIPTAAKTLLHEWFVSVVILKHPATVWSGER